MKSELLNGKERKGGKEGRGGEGEARRGEVRGELDSPSLVSHFRTRSLNLGWYVEAEAQLVPLKSLRPRLGLTLKNVSHK